MLTHVEFRSDEFPPYPGEEEHVNPGVYGKRLAEFVARGLRDAGFLAQEPDAEDWGWIVPIENQGFSLWVGCGRYQEYPDGFLCFIEPHRPVVRKLFRSINTEPVVARVQQAIDHALRTKTGVRDIRWWSHDEFNKSGA